MSRVIGQLALISKLYYIDCQQILDSDRDHQVFFVGGPN